MPRSRSTTAVVALNAVDTGRGSSAFGTGRGLVGEAVAPILENRREKLNKPVPKTWDEFADLESRAQGMSKWR